jgi:hypothetical protein
MTQELNSTNGVKTPKPTPRKVIIALIPSYKKLQNEEKKKSPGEGH